MTEAGDKTVTSTNRAWPLYGAAFATAIALSVCWTAMPFVLTGIDGTEAHVGSGYPVEIRKVKQDLADFSGMPGRHNFCFTCKTWLW